MQGLERFVKAQEKQYHIAWKEIKHGKKETHWMWYIFPQIKGLGYSETAKYYAIQSRQEAEDYLFHPTLGGRLLELCHILMYLPTNDAYEVFGFPDNKKLQSSMTLFYSVSGLQIFKRVLDKYFDGELDQETVRILNEENKKPEKKTTRNLKLFKRRKRK